MRRCARLMAFVVVSACAFGGSCGAFAPAYVDAHGVMRECGSDAAVTRFGVNYYPPFTVDFKHLKAAGHDIRRVMRDDVAHFRRLGLDCLRLHTFDREFSDPDGAFVANEHVELLDYLIALCASNGIQTVLTPIAWWGGAFAPGETRGFSNRFTMEEMTSKPEAWRIQARFLREFAQHRNPLTGYRYGDDPAVLAFELINEPHYVSNFSDDKLVEYINTLAAGLRSGGTTKPIFYNSWFDRHAAVARANIDGETNSTYPMGLCNHCELTGNLLARITANQLTAPLETTTRAKMIYEFDTADTSCSYLYPALARSFRHQGIQIANQFQYDALPLAPDNRDWETHYLNFIYTPAKALSFAIACKAFHLLPRGCDYPQGTQEAMSFPPFRVDARRDLSEFVTAEDYWYTSAPITPPLDVTRLKRVYGVGASSVAACNGTGIYFLDKAAQGVWRLQLYPDVFEIADPYTGRAGVKRVAIDAPLNFSAHLPDLGGDWRARRVADGVDVVTAKGGKVCLPPDDYVLVAQGASYAALPAVPRYVVPPLAPNVPRIGLKTLPREWGTTLPLPFDMRSRNARTMTLFAMACDDPSFVVRRSCVACDAASLALPAGNWNVGVAVEGPLGVATSATQRVRVYARARDWPLFRVSDALSANFDGRQRARRRATNDEKGRLAIGISVIASKEDACHYAGFRAPFSDAVRTRHFAAAGDSDEILVHARAAKDGERLEVVFSQTDGTAWGSTFPLTKEWKTHHLKVASFTPYWHTVANPKGRKADPKQFEKVNVGFGAWLFGKEAADSHAFELSDIRIP